jgi:hypothetical protein
MNLRRKLYNALPPPQYKASLVSGWQQVDDIVKAMLRQHEENRRDAKKIAKYLCGRDERETARNIFNFLKSEIQYEVEPSSRQSVKSISRFLSDGKGDCKHFTNFANSILEACGYQPVFRYAGYSSKGLQHTYTYLPKSDTVLDAVLPSFNTEKTPTIKKDYKMSLYKLSGVNDMDEINGINFSKIKDGLKKATTKTSQSVQKAVKSVPAVAKKVTQGMKTVSLAVPRSAFVGLVLLNFRGMATDIKKVVDKKGRESLKWWLDLGGNRDTLMDAVNKGASKKRLMGTQEEEDAWKEVYSGYSGDGVYVGEPVTIASAIATATPIIIATGKWLKENGVTENLSKVNDAVNTGKQTFKALTGKKLEDIVFKKDAGSEPGKMKLDSSMLSDVDNATATKVAQSGIALATGVDLATIQDMQNNPQPPPNTMTFPGGVLPMLKKPNNLLLIGGGVLVLFLLLKKK